MNLERTPAWACWLVAALATAFVIAARAPGRGDLPDRERTGIEARDDGYWTAPLRRVAGVGRQDAFDEDLALSLALPENALGVLAWRAGVPAADARFAGSALALFASLAAALLFRRAVPALMLAALLLTPPIAAHFGSDLGEGTAFGLVSVFGFAIVRRRLALAAFVAGVGIFQKACGLPLGVGVLAAVLIGRGRIARLRSAALGAAAGVAVSVGLAVAMFGDAPIAFVLRPFLATRDTDAGSDVRTLLVRALVPGAFEVGSAFFVVAAAAFIALPHRRIRAPIVTALFAGSLFAAAFPDPWRMLPTWMLLPALLADSRAPDARSARDPSPMLASMFLLAQTLAGGAHLRIGDAAHRIGALVAIAAGALAFDRLRARWPASRAVAIACGAVLAAPLAFFHAATPSQGTSTARTQLAQRIAARLPADAHLIGHAFLSTRFRGTLYYPPFQAHWEPELSRPNAPATLFRVLVSGSTTPPPAGYAVSASEALGLVTYGRDAGPVRAVLETLTRR